MVPSGGVGGFTGAFCCIYALCGISDQTSKAPSLPKRPSGHDGRYHFTLWRHYYFAFLRPGRYDLPVERAYDQHDLPAASLGRVWDNTLSENKRLDKSGNLYHNYRCVLCIY